MGGIATTMVAISFGLAAVVFSTQLHASEAAIVKILDWIHVGSFQVDISFIVDPLSSLYILFITGVGSLIHLYSIGYMHEDEGFHRFMSYLNLFVFFMLLSRTPFQYHKKYRNQCPFVADVKQQGIRCHKCPKHS